jgi:hypothetical protein
MFCPQPHSPRQPSQPRHHERKRQAHRHAQRHRWELPHQHALQRVERSARHEHHDLRQACRSFQRRQIENTCHKLKGWWRLHMRYARCARAFFSAIATPESQHTLEWHFYPTLALLRRFCFTRRSCPAPLEAAGSARGTRRARHNSDPEKTHGFHEATRR